MNLGTILKLLPKVGPVIAAAPEFKALVEEVIATLSDKRDQDELKLAYEQAISKADEAHAKLQQIVARNS